MNWNVRLLFILLIAILVVLQYRLWFGEGSFAEVQSLRHQLNDQQADLTSLRQVNASLRAEVHSLKTNDAAIESRARSELGMIRDGETYFQVIRPGQKDEE